MIGTYHFHPCPHCGEPMRAGTLARHEPACIRKPDIYARLRSVLVTADNTHGITYKRYLELSAADKTLPSLNTLIRRTKSTHWNGVLAFFKLSIPPQEVYCDKITAKHCEPKPKSQRKLQPKPTPKPAEPAPVALAVAPFEVREVSLPLPRIAPTVSKWAGTRGYDPTWKAPSGDTQWLVQVQPGERTCLACGDTFAAGGYCMRCGTWEDGTRRLKNEMPPSVPTAAYLHPEEYVTVR